MDANLERIMEHEKQLSAKLAEESEAVRREVEDFMHGEMVRAAARKEEARQESLKRREDLMNRERAVQDAMAQELHERYSGLARDDGIRGLVRETVIRFLFRGGGRT